MVSRRGAAHRRGASRKYVPSTPSGVSPTEHAKAVENELRSQYGQATRAVDFARGKGEQAEDERQMGPDEAAAIIRARAGDDTALFPYTPTPSINPPRPRTQAAGYSKDTQTLRIKFRDGAVYEYYDVPPNVWRNFRRWVSPGRGINRVLNHYPYARRTDLEA